jgi:hypothetical protein
MNDPEIIQIYDSDDDGAQNMEPEADDLIIVQEDDLTMSEEVTYIGTKPLSQILEEKHEEAKEYARQRQKLIADERRFQEAVGNHIDDHKMGYMEEERLIRENVARRTGTDVMDDEPEEVSDVNNSNRVCHPNLERRFYEVFQGKTGYQYGGEILGKPLPMPRPTFMNWVKNGVSRRAVVQRRSPQRIEFGLSMKTYLEKRWKGELPFYPIFGTDPVHLICKFFRPLPQDYFKGRDKARGLKEKYTEGCIINDPMTPDNDNLLKFVMDALEGIVYENDKQVVSLECSKWMDTRSPYNGRTFVRFEFQPEGWTKGKWQPPLGRNGYDRPVVDFKYDGNKKEDD